MAAKVEPDVPSVSGLCCIVNSGINCKQVRVYPVLPRRAIMLTYLQPIRSQSIACKSAVTFLGARMAPMRPTSCAVHDCPF